jgi:UDP-N-acetylmuramate dehydrogenase
MPVIQEQVPLLPYNTFRFDVSARYFTTIRSVSDVQELLNSKVFASHRHLILGGGSNILFTRDFDGLVVKNEIGGIEVVAEDNESIRLKVGSGVNWHEFVMHCVDHNYGGAENLSLIPGTMGAAPMQNIGAYGVEVKNIICEVHAIDLRTATEVTFSNEACKFGYRESFFKHEGRDKYFISSVTLSLTKKNHPFNISYGAIQETLSSFGVTNVTLKAISDAVIHIRRSKLPDPAVTGNAGSFFKNPSIPNFSYENLKKQFPSMPGYPEPDRMTKVPAGWLIEQCGWKGKTLNNVGVHPLQALVLVHYGGDEGKNVWDLAMQIQNSVKEKFSITLTPEVNIV